MPDPSPAITPRAAPGAPEVATGVAAGGATRDASGDAIRGATPPPAAPAKRHAVLGAGLAALGIVFGDLGTSPLYTMQTVIGSIGGAGTPVAAMGVLSLIVWALIVTVSVKYCLFVMRADNHGEGGILALMSLLGTQRGALVVAGLFGAALIYGDGIITPAISVLSALEGINLVTDVLRPYVMPGAVVILLLLFAGQSLGTARIGRVFGPVMLVWFATIALLGIVSVAQAPQVLAAIDPRFAVRFLAQHGTGSMVVLGGVFLAITGGEALYADMGHFGRLPIRGAWYVVVLPALLLNYAGQTALLLRQPKLSGNPFFQLAPGWAVIPLVALATIATIIASQAIITGAFSLTRQAIQLGWLPGLRIRQTSDTEYGQIYVPLVNWVMMVATVSLTIGFGSSDRLAGAYGTAVSTTMLLTTFLLFRAMRLWGWPVALALSVSALFLLVDVAFFAANLMKIAEGGWVPLLAGGVVFLMMSCWRRGVEAMRQRLANLTGRPEELLRRLAAGEVLRGPGTGVFLSRGSADLAPLMLRHVQQLGVLPKVAISLNVNFSQTPRVPVAERVSLRQVADGVWRMQVHYGFVEVPDLAAAMVCASEQGCPLALDQVVYYAARDEVAPPPDLPPGKPAPPRLLSGWRRMVFSVLYRNAVHAADRFNLPPDQVLEMGRRVAV
jgi:KUP system potassium uptake protein